MVSDTAASDEAAHVVSLQKELAETRSLVKKLTDRIARNENYDTIYAASCFASHSHDFNKIPEKGMPAKHVATVIEDVHLCDFNPLLNTSSYVNVTSEAEERKVAAMGAQINIADASVYPATIDLHDRVVNMIANLWHAPEPANEGNFAGAGTVGSTEGCLLAGLALKFRWREWYMKKHGLTSQQVLGVRPNLVISSIYQAAWEKFFRFFDVEAKVVKPNLVHDKMAANAHDLVSLCDEKTIAVVGILGNHYNGMYDPIWEIDREIEVLNAQKVREPLPLSFCACQNLCFWLTIPPLHRPHIGLANWYSRRWCEWRLHCTIPRDEWESHRRSLRLPSSKCTDHVWFWAQVW